MYSNYGSILYLSLSHLFKIIYILRETLDCFLFVQYLNEICQKIVYIYNKLLFIMSNFSSYYQLRLRLTLFAFSNCIFVLY